MIAISFPVSLNTLPRLPEPAQEPLLELRLPELSQILHCSFNHIR